MKTLILLLAGLTMLLAFTAGLVLVPWFYISIPGYKAECADYGKQTGHETKISQSSWSSVQCYVDVAGTWVAKDQIKFRED